MRLYPRHHHDTASRVLDEKAVVITLNDGRMHTLNEVGTWIWEHADGSRSVSDIIAALLEEFDVDEAIARADVASYVELLAERDVLELHEKPEGEG